MNKLLLASAITFVSLTALADESHLVFKTSDGAVSSIAASGLDIKFSDGNMVATNATESLTLPLASLVSMEFGGPASRLAGILTETDGLVTVTSVSGTLLGSFSSLSVAQSSLAPGIYVVRHASGDVTKILIGK